MNKRYFVHDSAGFIIVNITTKKFLFEDKTAHIDLLFMDWTDDIFKAKIFPADRREEMTKFVTTWNTFPNEIHQYEVVDIEKSIVIKTKKEL